MKVLVLCNRVPYPPNDGGAIAMYNTIKALKIAGHDVSVFALNTQKHFQSESQILNAFSNIAKVYAHPIDTSIKIVDAFLNLFKSSSYNVDRFYSKSAEDKLIEILKNNTFDVIQFETLFVCPYLEVVKKYSKAKLIYRSHNVESQIWFRLSKSSKTFKKWYFNFLAKRIEKYENEILNGFDIILSITEIDLLYFKKHYLNIKSFTLPVAVDLDEYLYSNESIIAEPQSIFHLGSLDWLPNLEAVDWLINDIIPILNNLNTEYKLYLAGKNTPKHLYQYDSKNIKIVGEVADAKSFMLSKDLMLVPLLSGGGMRVKILEGLALGKVIVSTSIGVEGIPCEHKKNILIADDARSFADAINWALNHPQECKKISAEAKELAKNFSISTISEKLKEYYQN